MASTIGDQIDVFNQSNLVIERWNNLKPILIYGGHGQYRKVADAHKDRYRGDFYGLLKQVFGIEDKLLYPNLIANDFNSPTDYNGEENIFILDSKSLSRFYTGLIKES